MFNRNFLYPLGQAVLSGALVVGGSAQAAERPDLVFESQVAIDGHELPRYAAKGPAPDVVALGVRLQDVALEIKLGGDLRGTETTLDQIWLELASQESYPLQAASLAALAHVRASLYAKQQDFVAARAAAGTSFLTTAHPKLRQNLAGFQRVGPEQLKAAAQQRQSMGALGELVQQLESKKSQDTSRLNALVEDAFRKTDARQLLLIGEAGYEKLEELILADADSFPLSSFDPISVLVSLNAERAGQSLNRNFDLGGKLWKRRLLLTLERDPSKLLESRATAGGESYVALYPDWVEILSKLVAMPDMSVKAAPLAGTLLLPGPSFAPLARALMGALKVQGEGLLYVLLRAHRGGRPLGHPVFSVAAQAKSTKIRLRLAGLVDNLGENTPLSLIETLLQDANDVVRLSAFFALVHPQRELSGRPSELVLRLSRDAVARQRFEAARAMTRFKEEIPQADFLRLMQDDDAGVRLAMVSVLKLRVDDMDAQAAAALLEVLSKDSDGEVRKATEHWLSTAGALEKTPALLSVLKERLFQSGHQEADFPIVWKWMASERVSQAIASWMDQASDAELAGMSRPLFWLGLEGVLGSLHLDPELRARLLSRAHQLGFKLPLKNRIWESRSQVVRAQVLSATEQVMHDSKELRATRLSCAEDAVGAWSGFRRGETAFHPLLTSSGLSASLLKLTRAATWREAPVSAKELATLGSLIGRLPSESRNALVLELLQSDACEDTLLKALVLRTNRRIASFAPLVMPIMERWFDVRHMEPAVAFALAGAFQLGDRLPSALLLDALRQPAYIESAMASMIVLRRDEFVEALGTHMELPGMRDQDARDIYAQKIINVLTAIGSDGAVEQLLASMNKGSASTQWACARALDAIEARRARLVRWEEGLSNRPSRASAMSELLTMLSDEDATVRALAVRGVGAFGAVEYIPTLIGLLKDPAEEVRVAVVDAVKRLSSLPVAGQGLPLEPRAEPMAEPMNEPGTEPNEG